MFSSVDALLRFLQSLRASEIALFSKDEQNAIKAVAKGSSLDPLLTLMAKFNPQRSQLVTGGAVGFGVQSPESLKYTIPIAAGGFAADKLQALMRRQAAEKAVSGLLTGTTPPPQPSYYGRGLLSTTMNLPPELRFPTDLPTD